MAATPNMNLTLPSPQVTPGPTYAQTNNTAFEAIDEHDHSTGRGVRITPAGLNINATVDFNGNDLSEANSVLFEDRSADISLTTGVYVKNGEFFYKDASGNAVQLTSGGSVAGTTGSFTGLSSPAAATYSSTNKRFTWTFDSSKFARMAQADLDLYPYDASTAYTKAITIKAPTGLEATASYSLSLPTALPAGAEIMTVDNAGLIDHASIAGTSNQVAVSSNATAIVLSLPSTVATSILQGGAGTVSAPSIAFSTDPNTGLYSGGDSQLNFSSNGVLVGGFGGNGIFSAFGAVGTPSYTFANDADTGVYRPAANQVGVSCGGTQRGLFSSGGLDVSGHLAATAALSTDTSLTVGTTADVTGALTAASLNLDGGGTFKVKVYTGTLSASASTTLNPGATVYGAFGWTTYNGTSTYTPIMLGIPGTISSAATSIEIAYGGGGTASTVTLNNLDSNSTNTYRVIIFHA